MRLPPSLVGKEQRDSPPCSAKNHFGVYSGTGKEYNGLQAMALPIVVAGLLTALSTIPDEFSECDLPILDPATYNYNVFFMTGGNLSHGSGRHIVKVDELSARVEVGLDNQGVGGKRQALPCRASGNDYFVAIYSNSGGKRNGITGLLDNSDPPNPNPDFGFVDRRWGNVPYCNEYWGKTPVTVGSTPTSDDIDWTKATPLGRSLACESFGGSCDLKNTSSICVVKVKNVIPEGKSMIMGTLTVNASKACAAEELAAFLNVTDAKVHVAPIVTFNSTSYDKVFIDGKNADTEIGEYIKAQAAAYAKMSLPDWGSFNDAMTIAKILFDGGDDNPCTKNKVLSGGVEAIHITLVVAIVGTGDTIYEQMDEAINALKELITEEEGLDDEDSFEDAHHFMSISKPQYVHKVCVTTESGTEESFMYSVAQARNETYIGRQAAMAFGVEYFEDDSGGTNQYYANGKDALACVADSGSKMASFLPGTTPPLYCDKDEDKYSLAEMLAMFFGGAAVGVILKFIADRGLAMRAGGSMGYVRDNLM